MWSKSIETLNPAHEIAMAIQAELEHERRRKETPIMRRATPFTRAIRLIRSLF